MINAFVIYLKTSELSCRLSSDAILAGKQHNIDISLWDGVHGASTAPSKLKSYNLKLNKHKNQNLTLGEIGCFLSHYELWQECVARNTPLTIMEHDGIFIRDLPDDILDNFDDVLHLDPGRTHISQLGGEYRKYVSNTLLSPIEYTYYRENETDIAGPYLYGAYGYIIKPHAAQKLINFASAEGVHPADVMIGRKIVDLKSTTATIVKLHDYYTEGDLLLAAQHGLTSPFSIIKKQENL